MCPDGKYNMAQVLTQDQIIGVLERHKQFEKNFDREHRNIDVFTVLPKGIYDTHALIEKPEHKFPESIRACFTDQILYDIRQAGRCLAFEAPTAAAFHVLRATEALIRDYYRVLAGQSWPFQQRDWGRYLTELNKLSGVNNDITSRLNEIKNCDRNPNIHPEANITLDKAPVMFELCSGVIYLMGAEITKRSP
jgi:hypothetical protein